MILDVLSLDVIAAFGLNLDSRWYYIVDNTENTVTVCL